MAPTIIPRLSVVCYIFPVLNAQPLQVFPYSIRPSSYPFWVFLVAFSFKIPIPRAAHNRSFHFQHIKHFDKSFKHLQFLIKCIPKYGSLTPAGYMACFTINWHYCCQYYKHKTFLRALLLKFGILLQIYLDQ